MTEPRKRKSLSPEPTPTGRMAKRIKDVYAGEDASLPDHMLAEIIQTTKDFEIIAGGGGEPELDHASRSLFRRPVQSLGGFNTPEHVRGDQGCGITLETSKKRRDVHANQQGYQ
jgi:hypothetical protein